jgi:hypothetical protein
VAGGGSFYLIWSSEASRQRCSAASRSLMVGGGKRRRIGLSWPGREARQSGPRQGNTDRDPGCGRRWSGLLVPGRRARSW